jgi:hypothetical protein
VVLIGVGGIQREGVVVLVADFVGVGRLAFQHCHQGARPAVEALLAARSDLYVLRSNANVLDGQLHRRVRQLAAEVAPMLRSALCGGVFVVR